MSKKNTSAPQQPIFSFSAAAQLLAAIFLCQAAGVIGAIFTTAAIPTWYVTLLKPFFSPPNWVFGPVWTLLYTMMGVALFLIWQKRDIDPRVHQALRWFTGQLVLNTLWSIVFFGQKDLWLAVGVILVLWYLIFKSIRQFLPISAWAGWLLAPYLAWVSFATVLNIAIAYLN